MEEGAPLHSSPSTPLCSTPLFSSTPTEDSPLLGNYKATVSVRFVEYQSTEQVPTSSTSQASSTSSPILLPNPFLHLLLLHTLPRRCG